MNEDLFQVLHVEIVNDENQGHEQHQACGREDRGSIGCESNEELISSSRATYRK